MPSTSRTEIFDVSREAFFKAITDYNSYPKFVDGVSSVKVLENSDSGARVEFSLNFIKKFSYVLKLKHDFPNSLSWTFESGDIFKSNTGSWTLKEVAPNKTEVIYNLEIDVKVFAPKALVNKLATVNLPQMMKSYADRAKEIANS